MSKDDDSNEGYSGRQSSGGGGFGGGGGFPGGNLIGFLLPLLMRNPKLFVIVLIVGGGYFLYNKSCSSQHKTKQEQAYSKGATLDQEVYDKNEVYAALDNDEPLPEKVSLERFTPDAKDQGQQGSCVGWGSTYYARTILESIKTGQNPNTIAFSPAFTYNQIGLQDCQGTYITKAVDLLTNVGSVGYNAFPYNENSCDQQPSQSQIQEAASFKMRGGNRLTLNGDDYTVDVNAIRQNLANNAPVVIGMMVGGTFMQEMEGKDVWLPSERDYNKRNFGGHCMCVIGYDDHFFENDGAFLIQNSWGQRWGKNGKAWVSYKDFVYFTNEAYGLDALPNQQNVNKLACDLALIDKDSKQEIPLVNTKANVYETQSNLKAGDKFKIRFANNVECFVYVFGKETDNTVYTLFPYTPKHSAYCGITGARVFPRDYSMEVDKIGNRDFIGVVISKQKLDYKTIASELSQNKTVDFSEKFKNYFYKQTISDVNYKSSNRISFVATTGEKTILPILIEIKK